MPDLGLTHVALTARDLDASIAFYAKYAGMAVVHRRAREGVRSVWLSDRTRPFVIVLVETADQRDHPLGPFLYTVSCMHCMTVSLADSGMGLGAMWGEQKALQMLSDAGFTSVDVKHVDGDIANAYFIATKN